MANKPYVVVEWNDTETEIRRKAGECDYSTIR